MDKIFDLFCKLSLIFMCCVFLNSVIGDMMYKIQYSFPKKSMIVKEVINPYTEPVQQNLDGKQTLEVFGEKKKYNLKLQAKYSISALVLTKNSNFWFRDVLRSRFDDICLIDFGLAWGELARDKEKLYKDWKFKSYKTLGMARRLEWQSKSYDNSGFDLEYVSGHVAHTHMIPANSNVMGALLKIKKDDIVKLDGYLVDIYDSKTGQTIAKTSLSRYDTDGTSRGYGACEDMYVKRVQIGNEVYE